MECLCEMLGINDSSKEELCANLHSSSCVHPAHSSYAGLLIKHSGEGGLKEVYMFTLVSDPFTFRVTYLNKKGEN